MFIMIFSLNNHESRKKEKVLSLRDYIFIIILIIMQWGHILKWTRIKHKTQHIIKWKVNKPIMMIMMRKI